MLEIDWLLLIRVYTNIHVISPYKNTGNTGKAPWIKNVYTSSHAFLNHFTPPLHARMK
jgi:hypothetical protein